MHEQFVSKVTYFLAVGLLCFNSVIAVADESMPIICTANAQLTLEAVTERYLIVPEHQICTLELQNFHALTPSKLELRQGAQLAVKATGNRHARTVVSLVSDSVYFGKDAIIRLAGADGANGANGKDYSHTQASYCTDGIAGGDGSNGSDGKNGLSVYLNIQLHEKSEMPIISTYGGLAGKGGLGGSGQRGGGKANDEAILKAAHSMQKLLGSLGHKKSVIDPKKLACKTNNREGRQGVQGNDGKPGKPGLSGSVWGQIKLSKTSNKTKLKDTRFIMSHTNHHGDAGKFFIVHPKSEGENPSYQVTSFIDLEIYQ